MFFLIIFIGLRLGKVLIIEPYVFFLAITILTSIAQWHFILFVIDEMTTILGIRVLRVKPKVPVAV